MPVYIPEIMRRYAGLRLQDQWIMNSCIEKKMVDAKTDLVICIPTHYLRNVNGHFDSRGMETNVKVGYSDFKLFLGYTFTKAYLHEGSAKTENYLTPRHRLNSVLLYEVEEKWKIGLEGYYFGKQKLSDGAIGKSYWITGFMIEKLWEKFSVYINFENFTDSRQTKFDTIYFGSFSDPQFRDIYAPLDGFVINGGVKLRL